MESGEDSDVSKFVSR